jgi:hypothetical protein
LIHEPPLPITSDKYLTAKKVNNSIGKEVENVKLIHGMDADMAFGEIIS